MPNYNIIIPKKHTHNIALGSAIIAEKTDSGYCIHFEGNLYNAENLKSFDAKLWQAASRKAQKYPTIAKMCFPEKTFQEDFLIVGSLDYDTAKANLQNRRNTQLTIEECIQNACQWISSETHRFIQWALPSQEKHFVAKSFQIAMPQEEEMDTSTKIQKFFESLEKEGKITFHRTTQKESITANPNLPKNEFWQTPTDKEKERKNQQSRIRELAEAAFLRELEEMNEQVEEIEGWKQCENHLSRIYYIVNPENPEGPSLKKSFSFETP